jgi:hypothetical protein
MQEEVIDTTSNRVGAQQVSAAPVDLSRIERPTKKRKIESYPDLKKSKSLSLYSSFEKSVPRPSNH